jgi:CP family cyanate transporter-like MFS transporter
MLISLLSGMAWDIGGMAVFAFLPVAIAAIPILFTIWTIPLESAPGNVCS